MSSLAGADQTFEFTKRSIRKLPFAYSLALQVGEEVLTEAHVRIIQVGVENVAV